MKYFSIFILIILMHCSSKNAEPKSQHMFTNALIKETSPYLLQHAHNPVNWHAWNNKTLKKAKDENKLLLISVGYSSCHWCHVMEHESFEDTTVAQVMNKNFINIKVDREERPDVDQVYMNALQILKGSGGWPLNMIALPDGRPVWGETYLPKTQWIDLLQQISKIHGETPQNLVKQADNLEKGIKSVSLITLNTNKPIFETQFITDAIKNWTSQFDTILGGITGTPKFMMPNNYQFLLRYAYQANQKEILDYVNLTLKKIAFGGVYDHVGGGFSRYSTDSIWHIPHFEKMLYDNAQLVSLYADAYLLTNKTLYKDVVEETLNFIHNEMTTSEGAFYSSFDADSNTTEGNLREGAFYTWQKQDLQLILKDDFNLFSKYYNINPYGLWENEDYVLIRKDDDSTFLKKNNISGTMLRAKKKKWKYALSKIRNKRPKPRLDDKVLTSWNGLMLKSYIDAYRVFKNEAYLKAAIKNADFIVSKLIQADGALHHTYKNGKSKINGYLDDYATVIDAFMQLYEITLNKKWLGIAMDLTKYTFKHFYDTTSSMFFYTSSIDASLVSRNIEYHDNVIPSSNSIMAKNIFKLSHHFDNASFETTAKRMLNNVLPEIIEYPSAYSNWLDLMLNYTNPFYEVVISGTTAKEKILELNSYFIPNKLVAGSTLADDMPLLKNRFNPEKTLIYVCVNKSCKLPVLKVEQAVTLLNK